LQYLFQQHRLSLQEFLEYIENPQEFPDSFYELRETPEATKFIVKSEFLSQRERFGSFVLLGELGRGGMGVVYKAYHPALSRIVALKVFLQEKASENLTQRFYREIQVMAKLEHPNIVQVFSAGEEKGKPYLVMEFVPGKTLEELKSSEKENRTILLIFQKILLALHYMHQQGIIHRDLKPANIFLNPEGEPKIGDFGLAQEMASKQTKLTQQGILIGTIPYMSPEQVQGKSLTAQSDVYSIGVCLYELLTKKLPHRESRLNGLLDQILHQEPPLPSHYNPKIHKSVEQILLKALEKSPEQRYSTAEAFAQDLDDFLSGQPILADISCTKRKYVRLYKKYRWPIFLSSPLLLFLFSALLFLKISQVQERQKQFSNALALARQDTLIAQQPNYSLEWKFKHFFSAFLRFNIALSYKPEHPETETEKRISVENFIALACQKESYQLAQYLTEDLKKLSTLSDPEKNNLSSSVKKAQTKLLRKHLQRLDYWIQYFQTQEVNKNIRKEAIFEISQMKEEEVFQKLILLIEESVEYSLMQQNLSIQRIQFYIIFIEAFGRMKNPKYGKFLLNKLKQLEQNAFSKTKSIPYIHLMGALANSLGYLQDPQYLEEFMEIRMNMAKNDIFERLTRKTVSQLLHFKTFSEETLQSANDYLFRAYYKLEKKDFSGAIKDFTSVLDIDSKQVDIYFLRGTARQEQKDFENAIKDFDESILFDPLNTEKYLARASVYQEMNQLDKALNDYQKILEMDPKNCKAYLNRSVLKFSQIDFQGALTDVNQALLLNPYQEEAYTHRAGIRLNMGDSAGAIKDLDQAIYLDPQNNNSFNARGLAYFYQGEVTNALKDFEESIRLNPQDGYPYYNRANVKRALKDFQGAFLDYNEAVRLTPDSIVFLYDRGLTRNLLKDTVGCLQDFQKVLEMIQSTPSLVGNQIRYEILQEFPALKK
ncbi:MAG: protein kinase, partial [Planctomycetota bacterium]